MKKIKKHKKKHQIKKKYESPKLTNYGNIKSVVKARKGGGGFDGGGGKPNSRASGWPPT
ncbi:MAG: hypothetical protein IPM57_09610 [Oligoflexia bacterium]|nr:hypothetical protein [Oligoflexia bacterium]